MRERTRDGHFADAGPGGTSASAVWVADVPISFERVEERLAELRRSPRGRRLPPGEGPETEQTRRWILRELITEALIAHESIACGVGTVADLFAHVTASVRVPVDAIRAFYRHNHDRFRRPQTRRIRHLVCTDLTAATAAAAAATATATGEHSAATRWEILLVHQGELAGELEDALFAAAVGTIVGPIRTEHGWHVAWIESMDPESLSPFGEVRDAIEAELLVEARGRAFDEWLEARRRSLVVSDTRVDHPGLPVAGFARHRH